MNRATLIGRVGKDPEIRTFSNGNKVANFSLATSERWRDKNTGERKEKTEWHNIAVFNEPLIKLAEAWIKKGSMIALEGQIQTRKYQDKNGNDRYMTEIVLQNFNGYIELLGGKSEGGSDKREEQGSGTANRLADDLSDEIPFAPEWR